MTRPIWIKTEILIGKPKWSRIFSRHYYYYVPVAFQPTSTYLFNDEAGHQPCILVQIGAVHFQSIRLKIDFLDLDVKYSGTHLPSRTSAWNSLYIVRKHWSRSFRTTAFYADKEETSFDWLYTECFQKWLCSDQSKSCLPLAASLPSIPFRIFRLTE